MNLKRSLPALLPLVLATSFFAAGPAESGTPKQSPVNVTPGAFRFDPHAPKLDVTYGSSALELRYVRKDADAADGCAVRHHEETEEAAVEPGAGHVTVAGTRYDLVQFHFHTPSEHQFSGHGYPLEMHLVHRSAEGKLLVVGVPLRVGAHSVVDDVLAKLAPECGAPVDVEPINLNRLLPVSHHTLHYTGSLTTAPFTEGVEWYLTAEQTVSAATIARFQGVFTAGNARATQPLNGRTLIEVPRI
ncbi:carbonic anhydrase family protein [Nocardia sp. NRRL S-836]|uniref:carbonic anhydrase family protein n=1 Tax=Nocardia sp. NRRL S-836 TaxID=1519492 RepID=UPI0009E6AA7F|nr:carbonic anhydrase family protein [Nocardia sp. NRRL S-836]